MSLYLDEMFPPATAARARVLGIDIVSLHEMGWHGTPDAKVLELAVRDGRAIVTQNFRDYLRLADVYESAGKWHAGIVLVPKSYRPDAIAAVADAIARFLAAQPGRPHANSADWLPPRRIS